MPFERAEQEESQERRIDAGANAIARDQRKDTMVVAFLGRRLHRFQQFVDGHFFCQDCGIERPLRGKVFEDQRLAHAGRFGDFFGRGAVEPFRGEERSGGHDEAGLTIARRSPLSRSWSVWFVSSW